ncbi:hypothetical protein PFISCL1PPCAC_14566, partial [Pristionchus fissidentatus]
RHTSVEATSKVTNATPSLYSPTSLNASDEIKKAHSIGGSTEARTSTTQKSDGNSLDGFTHQNEMIMIKPSGNVNEIEDEQYYYGYMGRDEAEKVLERAGDFLVRKTELRGVEAFVLSFCSEPSKKSHYRINTTRNG